MRTEGFAERLRELRVRAGLTQRELAQQAGMALGGLTKLEQGINQPSWESAVRLADALGVAVLAFLEEPRPLPPARRGRPAKTPTEKPARKPKRPRKGKGA